MKSIFAIGFASLYGFFLHFIYGFLGGIISVMSISFLALVPMGAGYLTIAFYKSKDPVSAGSAFFLPWLTSLVLLFLSIILSVEGAICWVMIYPFFAVMAGFGGLIARFVRLKKQKEDRSPDSTLLDDLRDWGKPDNLKTSLLLMAPLFLGVIESDRSLSSQSYTITKIVMIYAPPERIWSELTRVNNIAPEENSGWMTHTLGMPRHLRTELDTPAVGGHRIAVYEHGLVFDETITRYEPQHLMTIDVRADPKKIPPTVLDEHIVVGGRHFSTIEDEYILDVLPGGQCRLQLSGQYTITTPFNWYAGIWAKWLVEDVLEEVVDIVKTRAERR